MKLLAPPLVAENAVAMCRDEQSGGISEHDKSLTVAGSTEFTTAEKHPKPKEMQFLDTPCHSDSSDVANAPQGIRTPNLRFRRPTLCPIELGAHLEESSD